MSILNLKFPDASSLTLFALALLLTLFPTLLSWQTFFVDDTVQKFARHFALRIICVSLILSLIVNNTFSRLDGIISLVDAKHIEQHLDAETPEGVMNESVAQVCPIFSHPYNHHAQLSIPCGALITALWHNRADFALVITLSAYP